MLFLLSERSITLNVYLCLIFTIGSFRKIQIFFTDLQQTVCGSNWFISQNPDIFFFISQNPDFINVVENVDFAKSRFFLFRRIQIFFYFAESIFRNFAKSIFRKIQLAMPGPSIRSAQFISICTSWNFWRSKRIKIPCTRFQIVALKANKVAHVST